MIPSVVRHLILCDRGMYGAATVQLRITDLYMITYSTTSVAVRPTVFPV